MYNPHSLTIHIPYHPSPTASKQDMICEKNKTLAEHLQNNSLANIFIPTLHIFKPMKVIK